MNLSCLNKICKLLKGEPEHKTSRGRGDEAKKRKWKIK